MKKIALGITLGLGLVGSIHAAMNGGGGGYGGSAWFDSGQGVVATGNTYTECNTMLQNAINYRVSNWGWTVTDYNPCQKRGQVRRER